MFLTKCCVAAMLSGSLGIRILQQRAKQLFQTYCISVIPDAVNPWEKSLKIILPSLFHVIPETIFRPNERVLITHCGCHYILLRLQQKIFAGVDARVDLVPRGYRVGRS
jgi:hypothetical protein